jgi:hypothetical protein
MKEGSPDSQMESAFKALKKALRSEFPARFGLPRRLLNAMKKQDRTYSLQELGKMAKNWSPLKDTSDLPANTFETLVTLAISVIRGTTIYLFSIGQNPFHLTIENEKGTIKWSEERQYMEKVLNSRDTDRGHQ